MEWVENFWRRPHRHGHVTVGGAASRECMQTLDTYNPMLAQQIADRLQDAADKLPD